MCTDRNSKDQPGSSGNLGRNVPIPIFIHDQPTVWVGLLEEWFKLNRITDDEDQFYFALTALPAEVTVDFLDVATRPLAKNTFALLRSALIEWLGNSEKQRTGIMKIDIPLLGEVFLARLPVNTQAGLAPTNIGRLSAIIIQPPICIIMGK